MEQHGSRDTARGCVSADGQPESADPVADLIVGHAIAHGFDDTGRLNAKAAGHRHLVNAATVIGVDEIETDGGVAHAHFAGTGFGQLHIDPLNDLRAALFGYADGAFHGHASFSRLSRASFAEDRGGRQVGLVVVPRFGLFACVFGSLFLGLALTFLRLAHLPSALFVGFRLARDWLVVVASMTAPATLNGAVTTSAAIWVTQPQRKKGRRRAGTIRMQLR